MYYPIHELIDMTRIEVTNIPTTTPSRTYMVS